MNDFETRSINHIGALTHQLREAFTEYAAEAELTGQKLAELLHDHGVKTLTQDDGSLSIIDVDDESCDFMLANAEQLGMGDCLVLLEVLGAQVDIMVTLPVESQKKLLTPKKQHRLQVARHMNDIPRKLGKRKE